MPDKSIVEKWGCVEEINDWVPDQYLPILMSLLENKCVNSAIGAGFIVVGETHSKVVEDIIYTPSRKLYAWCPVTLAP